jgi:hypothetical protein
LALVDDEVMDEVAPFLDAADTRRRHGLHEFSGEGP